MLVRTLRINNHSHHFPPTGTTRTILDKGNCKEDNKETVAVNEAREEKGTKMKK